MKSNQLILSISLLVVSGAFNMMLGQQLHKAKIAPLCEAVPLPPSTIKQAYDRTYPASIQKIEIDKFYKGHENKLKDLEELIARTAEKNRKLNAGTLPDASEEDKEEALDGLTIAEEFVKKYWNDFKKGNHKNPSPGLKKLIDAEKEILANKARAKEYLDNMNDDEKMDFIIYYLSQNTNWIKKLQETGNKVSKSGINPDEIKTLSELIKAVEPGLDTIEALMPPVELEKRYKTRLDDIQKGGDRDVAGLPMTSRGELGEN